MRVYPDTKQGGKVRQIDHDARPVMTSLSMSRSPTVIGQPTPHTSTLPAS